MNAKLSLSVLAVSACVLVATLTAQTGASQDKMGQMKAKMAQMKDKMKAKMETKMAESKSDEMSHHREITQLVDKVAQTFAAVQAEKDPAALAQKLAAHEAAIKELQAKIAEHEKMMATEEAAKPADAAAPADPHAGHH
ncbi:MAG: hypothetical protein RL328_519 [Acidobacteriota bacterium]|jgi:uncharacterized coiled-coil protein SlyX